MKKIGKERKFLIDRLGYFRNREKLSARELSQRLGFSIAYIAKFENGDFNMPTEVLLKAIEICKTTPEEFFSEHVNEYEELKEITNQYLKLSDDNKNTIKDLLKNLK